MSSYRYALMAFLMSLSSIASSAPPCVYFRLKESYPVRSNQHIRVETYSVTCMDLYYFETYVTHLEYNETVYIVMTHTLESAHLRHFEAERWSTYKYRRVEVEDLLNLNHGYLTQDEFTLNN